MNGVATPATGLEWIGGPSLRRELVKVSAFFLRNWRMSHRNVWPEQIVLPWPLSSVSDHPDAGYPSLEMESPAFHY